MYLLVKALKGMISGPTLLDLEADVQVRGVRLPVVFGRQKEQVAKQLTVSLWGYCILIVKRVNKLDFYNLSRNQLAMKVGLSGPKTTAIIRYLGLQSDSDCYKEFIRGKTRFQGYSQKAITKIKYLLKNST